MAADEPQMLTVGEGDAARRIAVLVDPPCRPGMPTLLWLSGFKSDMSGIKTVEVAAWARAQGYGCIRFDYSGHGRSEGAFEEGTIGRWLEETIAVCDRHARGSVIVIGSSMGGYLALLLARHMVVSSGHPPSSLSGLVLIAPAWDMTEELMWKRFPEDVRREILETGVFLRPSRYGDGPYAITRKLIEDGRHHLVAAKPFVPGCPIEILHGRLDPDVPFAHSERLLDVLPSARIRLTPVDDGEHRLSRPEDIAALLALVERVAAPGAASSG